MTAPRLSAGEIEVRQINNFLLGLSGGSGARAWHIRYGTVRRDAEFKTLAGPGSVAYFSHYNWLRRIDTDKGIVTGRWLFPGQAITGLQWMDGHLRVDVAQSGNRNGPVPRSFEFDPGNPRVPVANQIYSEVSRAEGLRGFARIRGFTVTEAQRVLPELENAFRRDAFSPWLAIALGHIYRVLSRPESERTIDLGVRTASAYFSELLDISNYLEEKNEREAARLAFELGYADFWQQGQDPRLTSFLLVQGLIIRPDTPSSIQRALIDRAYATGPWVDGAARAWELYGKSLAADGDSKEAQLWLERAKEARNNGLLVSGDDRYFEALTASLVTSTTLAAALLYVVVLYFRYRPQRKARGAAERAAGVSRPGFCNVEYWRRSERLAFLSIVALAWIAEGFAGSALRASSVQSFGFFEMKDGSLLGPSSLYSLESRIAKSPERDLLLAIAYQRDGQPEKAASLYRNLPQLAESWNNLGVLLKTTGDAEGSRRSFDQALRLRPDFPEAEWNLGKPARGEWVKLHEQYAADKPMMTVPTRAQVLKAYGIREDSVGWATVLRGPLEKDDDVNKFFRPRGRMRAGVLIFLATGALILVFMHPREVLLAPPRRQIVLELLFPGTARMWGALGGIVLVAACYASSALWPPGWTRMYSYMNYGTSFRRFPLPFSVTMGGAPAFLSPIPSFWWLAALLMLNAGVVLLWKWRRK